MRQVVLTAPKQIEFREVAAPEAGNLKSDEVLLRILRIGICGSEIHSYHGQHPATFYPVVQGHEYSAEVVAVGSAVRKVKPGDRVTGRPQLVCGECNPCKRGQYNVCSNLRVEAFQADGVAQDYFVIPEERVVALPEGMSPDYGAMVEPTAVAAHATSRPRALEGRNVVVSGAGTIGNLVAQFARARGAKRVVITDVSDYRLSKARECGIERTLNVAREPLDGKIAELFGDEGYQVAFECAGVESSVRSLMATVEKGGDVVIVGVHAKDPAVSMFHLGEHELNLIGSMMYRHEDYLKAVEEISAGRIRLAPLVSNRFPLEKYREAYEFIDANRETCMKVLIVSDTHGRDENLEIAINREAPFDMLVHCGDVEGREFYIEALAECPCSIVSGNNDFFSDLPREDVIEVEGNKILVTHGHYYGVSMAFDQLAEAARSRGCNAAFFGHIHVPVVEKEAGVLLVNPGSLAYPRQRGRRPSYAVMETDGKGEMHVEIRYL